MQKIFKPRGFEDTVVVAEFKGEKVLRKGTKYFYVMPNQPFKEKAIPLPFEEGIRISFELQQKNDKIFEEHISKIPHKVLVESVAGKIIEGIKGKYDGAYYYVLPDGRCKIISEELALKMVKDLRRLENEF